MLWSLFYCNTPLKTAVNRPNWQDRAKTPAPRKHTWKIGSQQWTIAKSILRADLPGLCMHSCTLCPMHTQIHSLRLTKVCQSSIFAEYEFYYLTFYGLLYNITLFHPFKKCLLSILWCDEFILEIFMLYQATNFIYIFFKIKKLHSVLDHTHNVKNLLSSLGS